MTSRSKRVGLFPGTFDPITNGHLDLIRRAAKLFDELVVAVGDNPQKAALLDKAERVEIVRQVVCDIPNVRVESYAGLTVHMARKLGAAAILRGIRNSSDVHFELQVAMTNEAAGGVETVFLVTAAQHAFLSSSLIKQIATMGGDISAMVPPEAIACVLARCKRPPGDDSPSEAP